MKGRCGVERVDRRKTDKAVMDSRSTYTSQG